MYVAHFSAGLRLYDIADPRDVREVGYFLPPDPVRRFAPLPTQLVAQSEDVLVDARGYAYVTDKNQGLHIVRAVPGAASVHDGYARADHWFRWTVETAYLVAAPPERVWSVLTDLASYPAWNPFIVEAAGDVRVGETLTLQMVLPGRGAQEIRPRLVVVDPPRELRWQGRLGVPGLLDGEHWFSLEPVDGGTRVVHREHLSGALIPLAGASTRESILEAFRGMDAGLRARATSF